jgi:hypothetical protein
LLAENTAAAATGNQASVFFPTSTGASTYWQLIGRQNSATANDQTLRVVFGGVAQHTYFNASDLSVQSGITLKVLDTTASTSTSTGALVVSGGLGVGGAIFAGGNLTVSGTGTSSVAGLLNVGTGTANYSAAGRATVSISGGSQSLLGFSIGNATKGYLLHEGTNLYVANEAAGSVIIAGGSSTTSATFTSTLTTLAGNLNVSGTGTSDFSGKIRGIYLGVNANPQSGSLRGYFVESTAEGTPTFTGGEVIVVQRNAISAQACEMALIGGTASTCVYAFGDKDSANIGRISYNHSNNSLALVTNSATAATITSGGNVLVGTTTDGGYKLDVNGTARIQSNLTVSGGTTTLTGTAYLDLDEASNRRWRVFPNGGIFTVRDMVAVADYLTITGGSGDATVGGSIKTRAPSGGTAKPWELGEAATVSPTSPNRTIRVEIDGTVYYLHAKTTND